MGPEILLRGMLKLGEPIRIPALIEPLKRPLAFDARSLTQHLHRCAGGLITPTRGCTLPSRSHSGRLE